MNKKLTVVIIAQSLLILVLFWVVIFYAKDEYEAYRAKQDDEIESPSRVSTINGINTIKISAETQKNSGIQTDRLHAASFKGRLKSTGSVVSVDGLIESKAKYLALKSEIVASRAAYLQNSKQYQRLKDLNADDKNVSDQALQEAEALSNADQAKMQAAELQLKNLQSTVTLQWGEALAKLVFDDQVAKDLQGLLNRKNVLVQISLPSNINTPTAGSSLLISPINEAGNPIHATYISPAAQTDASSYGKTFYYLAPSESLRIGMRVNAELPNNANVSNGAVVPVSAIVWYAGKPWIYVKSGKDTFRRKPVSADIETEDGWFNLGMSSNDEVVINGAQLLLSEEFKFQIKNENQD